MKILVKFESQLWDVPEEIGRMRGEKRNEAVNEWLSQLFPDHDTGWEFLSLSAERRLKRQETRRMK